MNPLIYFYEFFIAAFITLNPGYKFIPNWYTHLLILILKAISDKKLKRLIINIPPRYLKSIALSVVLPAWIIGHDLRQRIIVCSYSQKLSNKLSQDCKGLLLEPWVQAVFNCINIAKKQNQVSKFITIQGGFRMATSTLGTLIGEGGDVLIVDDPHNVVHINSYNMRNKTIEWFHNSFMTRLNDKENGAVIVVMQRLHHNDLSGYLLENDKSHQWMHIALPVINYYDSIYLLDNISIWRRANTPLHYMRENIDLLNKIKMDLGESVFATQYMQQPLQISNTFLIKEKWFNFCDIPPFKTDYIIQSWDTAINVGINHDYTVCTTWGLSLELGIILYDVLRIKIEFPELKQKILSTAQDWNCSIVLIEDKSSGATLIQDILHPPFNLQAIKPIQDKVTRFLNASGILTSGKVWVLNKAWRHEIRDEILNFPNARHDDVVDTISQFLGFIKDQRRVLGIKFL